MSREDPLVAFKFGLEIEGKLSGYFTSVSGIGSESEIVEHKIVDDSTGETIIQKIPGRLAWTEVSLKRGVTSNIDIWDWRKMIVDGDVDGARTNCSIVAYNQANEEIARWNFENAWPLKVSGPSVKSDSNEFGIEELVITHEGLYREK